MNQPLPYNSDAEKSVIGSMLMDRDAAMAMLERLQPEDFYSNANGAIFRACKSVVGKGKEIDYVSITDELEQAQRLDAAGGYDYITEVLTFLPSAARADQYADIVIRDSMSRNLIRAAIKAQDEASDGGADPNDVAVDLIKTVDEITRRGNKNIPEYTAEQMVSRAMDRVEHAMEHPGAIQENRLMTGWPEHDRYCGFRRGNNVIIAGRPGLGKSAYAAGMAYALAGNGYSGLIFSKEMTEAEMGDRMVSQMSGVPLESVRNAYLTQDDLSQIWSSVSNVGRYDLVTVDDPSMTMAQICNRCKRQKARHKLDFVLIDYLQLVSPGREYKSDSREREVSQMSWAVKELAMKLKIMTLTVCQLNRDPDKRQVKKPALSDLRESGSIENDADVVIMLYRESYYNEAKANDRSADALIRKNRNGPTWTIPMIWTPETVSYREKPIMRVGQTPVKKQRQD